MGAKATGAGRPAAARVSARLAGGCAGGPPPTGAGRIQTGFLFDSFASGGRTFRYAVYVPRTYDGTSPWPLILFLHGKGESGTDGRKMTGTGLGSAIRRRPKEWPFLVVFPQKPTEDSEWEEFEPAVLEALARVRERYRVDPSRISLTGLSQGGHGAWVLGARHAGLWAAIAPVCGYAGSPLPDETAFHGPVSELARPIASTPVWAFHGEADPVVPVVATLEMVAAIRSAGGDPKATIYPGVKHDAWDRAYRDEGLAAWLLAQRR